MSDQLHDAALDELRERFHDVVVLGRLRLASINRIRHQSNRYESIEEFQKELFVVASELGSAAVGLGVLDISEVQDLARITIAENPVIGAFGTYLDVGLARAAERHARRSEAMRVESLSQSAARYVRARDRYSVLVQEKSLDQVNRNRVQGFQFRSCQHAGRELGAVASELSSFFVKIGILTPAQARALVTDFQQAHPELFEAEGSRG